MAGARSGGRARRESRDAPIVLILGADSYIAEGALEALLTETIGADRGDGLGVLRGDEVSWTQIVDAARSPSLFAPHKVVVVREAEKARGSEEALEELLSAPPVGLTLVLMAGQPDRRRTVWKRLQAKALVIPAEPLKGRALRSRVVEEFRRRGLTIEDEGLDDLLDRVGADLRRLVGEIDKLEAFAAPRRALAADDVEAVLGRGIARPLYRLSDAVVERDAAAAVELLDEILEEGEAAPLVLGTIFRALRQVRGARLLRGAPAAELASTLRVPPFKVEALRRAAGRWSDAQLRRALAAVAEADRRIKSGVDAKTALTAATVACTLSAQASAKDGNR